MVTCLVTQLCLTLCDPMYCSPPDSSVHGVLKATIVKWFDYAKAFDCVDQNKLENS